MWVKFIIIVIYLINIEMCFKCVICCLVGVKKEEREGVLVVVDIFNFLN